METVNLAIVGDVHLSDSPPRSWQLDYFTVVLNKVKWILENHDQVLFLGDIFHKPTLSNAGEIQLIKTLVPYRGKVRTILGNHDIYNMSLESLPRTASKKFSELGLIEIIDTFSIGPVLFETIPMEKEPKVKAASSKNSVLLGHCFFECNLDPRFSITREDLTGKGYKYVFLGHDHEPHKPLQLEDGTRLVRHGSLTRNTSHRYNLARQPQIVSMKIDITGIKKVDLVTVPAYKPEEIFYPEAFAKDQNSSMAFMTSIKEALTSFQKAASREGVMTIARALSELKAHPDVIEKIKGAYERKLLRYI